MSNSGTLIALIDKSQKTLATAQEVAEKTMRPNNVCAGHDVLFSLVRAVADGVSTSLAVSAGRLMESEVSSASMVDAGATAGNVWPQVWKFVNANARTILAWIGIWGIAIILKGELKTLLDSTLPQKPAATSASTGFGTYQEAPYP